jgi:hypothetical protein
MEDLYTDGYLSVYIDTGMGFVIYTRPWGSSEKILCSEIRKLILLRIICYKFQSYLACSCC